VWYDKTGAPSVAFSANDFMKRYNKDDAAQLTDAIDRLVTRHKDNRGHEVQEETLELRAKDTEYGDMELHDFIVNLTILQRNRKRRPTVIVAVKRDITKEHRLKRINAERSLRYLSVFYNDESGNILFNSEGVLQNANPKASELLECDIDEMVKNRVHINDLFHTSFTNLEEADGHRGSMTTGSHTVDFQMKAIYNDKKELIGLFVFCV
jgi:PAS domain-containing protein